MAERGKRALPKLASLLHMGLMPKPKAKRGGKPPWEKAAPKGTKHTKLTHSQKASAKRSAKKAGRPYPSLVDNMNAAKKKKKK